MEIRIGKEQIPLPMVTLASMVTEATEQPLPIVVSETLVHRLCGRAMEPLSPTPSTTEATSTESTTSVSTDLLTAVTTTAIRSLVGITLTVDRRLDGLAPAPLLETCPSKTIRSAAGTTTAQATVDTKLLAKQETRVATRESLYSFFKTTIRR